MSPTVRSRRGFTFLELLVVVVVFGILVLIAIPSYTSVISQSAEESAAHSARAVARSANVLAAYDYGPGSTTSWVHLQAALAEIDVVLPDGELEHEIVVQVGDRAGTACVYLDAETSQAEVSLGACA